jgi:hypothetical protein
MPLTIQRRDIDMENKTELNVVQSMYDKIYDLLTYVPSGKKPSYDAQTTYIQLVSPSHTINPKDFEKMVTPKNPNGDLSANNIFADLIDLVPAVSPDYNPTAISSDKTYGMVVNANAISEPDQKQLEIYNKAYKYLNNEVIIKDYQGIEKKAIMATPIKDNYDTNMIGYLSALSAYRTAFNNYDMTDLKQQREWQANAPLLEAAVDRAWNTWRAQAASQVEDAMAAIDHSINSAVKGVLNNCEKIYKNTELSPLIQGGAPWHLAYGLPSNWYNDAKLYSELKIDSKKVKLDSKSKSVETGFGASYSEGMWWWKKSISASADYSKKDEQSHTRAENINISMKLCPVQIVRPWFNALIFSMGGWFLDKDNPKGKISKGVLGDTKDTIMPLLPVGFVAARDVTLSGFSKDEFESHMDRDFSVGASVGWGPFTFGGHYHQHDKEDHFEASYENGDVRVPGVQIIAWVNQIVPLSPPLNAP